MSRYKSADRNYLEKEKKQQQQCHKVSNEPLMLSDAAKQWSRSNYNYNYN